MIDIGDMQFEFMLGKRIIDAIFIARQQLEKYLAKKRNLCKSWKMRKLDVDE